MTAAQIVTITTAAGWGFLAGHLTGKSTAYHPHTMPTASADYQLRIRPITDALAALIGHAHNLTVEDLRELEATAASLADEAALDEGNKPSER